MHVVIPSAPAFGASLEQIYELFPAVVDMGA